MLILQRKAGESVLIGEDIEVSILSVEAGRVRLAIQAPKSVPILRSELRTWSLMTTGQRRFTVLPATGFRATHRA